MPNTIIIKNSSTVSDVPTVGQLEQGELAINLLDEKLYSKNSSDLIFEIGGGGGAAATNFIINADINTSTPPTTETVTAELLFKDLADDDQLATIGFTGANDLEIVNNMEEVNAKIILRGTDTGGGTIDFFEFSPGSGGFIRSGHNLALYCDTNQQALQATINSITALYYNGIAVAQTTTSALGGWVADNDYNGQAGFERVLTESDIHRGLPIGLYSYLAGIGGGDPGAGKVAFNSFTPASITSCTIDDNSESTHDMAWLYSQIGVGDVLVFASEVDTADYITFTVDSVTDSTGYWTIGVTYVDGGTIFSSNDFIRMTWIPLSQAGGASALNDLSDVDTTGFATGDLLFKTAGDWNPTAGRLYWADPALTIEGNGTEATLYFDSSGAANNMSISYRVAGDTKLRTFFNQSTRDFIWEDRDAVNADRMVLDIDTGDLLVTGVMSADGGVTVRGGTDLTLNDSLNTSIATIDRTATELNFDLDVASDDYIFRTAGASRLRILGSSTIELDLNTNFNGWCYTLASTTGNAGFNIPEGVAPTSPNDGDVWVTAAGSFFARLNGVSVDLAAGGGGTIGGSITDNQIAVGATTADDIEGSASLTWDGTDFNIAGDLTADQITGELDGLGLYLSHSTGGEVLTIHSTGGGEVDFGFTNVTQVNFDSGGKYDFSNDTVQSVGELYLTEQASSAGNISNQFQLWARNSSPNVLFGKTGDGDEHPIGYNSMPPKAISASQNMLLADVGYMLHKSSGVAITLTCAQDTNTWDGATWAVHNDDTENVTIAAGASVTVYWLEAGSAPAAGSVVVEQGGIVTVYKRSNTEFWVWGAKDASGNDWGADGTMSDGFDIAWSGASQPWLVLDSDSAGDNWTSQGAGLSVGESGKKGSAAIHMTYNGDGSGYVGMGTVDDTAATGGRPAFGHLDFTYNAHLVRVGGRLYPGDNSNTVGTVGYIEHAGGQNYGSINVAGAAGSSGTYSGVSVNSRLVLMNNASTTSGLYNDQNNGWFIQCIEAGAVSLYHNAGLEFRTQQHEGSSITSGAEVYDHAGTFRDVGFNHVKEIAVTTVTLSNLHAGNILRKSGASSYTITLAASSTEFPIGSMCTVLNHGTGGTLTISDGSEAMYIMDGSGTITDSTGFVLAVGGAITIWRQGASAYYVWGAGIP